MSTTIHFNGHISGKDLGDVFLSQTAYSEIIQEILLQFCNYHLLCLDIDISFDTCRTYLTRQDDKSMSSKVTNIAVVLVKT